MSCLADYIGLHRTIKTSTSGLYATGLKGVELSAFDDLTKSDQDDVEEMWLELYERSIIGFIQDLSEALQKNFITVNNLIVKETSEYEPETNVATGDAGMKISISLSQYSVLRLLEIGYISDSAFNSPEFAIRVYDKDNILIDTITQESIAGKNTIFLDKSYNEDLIYLKYDAELYPLRKTTNKFFNGPGYSKLNCTFPCYFGAGSVYQLNGGGLNVKFVVSCDLRKFICANINLFKYALWYKTGVELMNERITTDNVTPYITLDIERATQLMEQYSSDYTKALKVAVDPLRISEDPWCFMCRGFSSTQNYIP